MIGRAVDPTMVSNKAMMIYRDLTLGVAPFHRKESNINEFNQRVLTELFTQLYSTGESILMLTGFGAIWEADILVRTLFEGTLKYIYMVQDRLDKKSELIEEYYNIIPEMQKISEHEYAVEAISMFKSVEIDKHPFQVSILREKELAELKDKYSKNRVRELSQKWSYKNILKNLIIKNDNYRTFTTTLYTYSFSSHLIHYDGKCLRQRAEALFDNAVGDNDSFNLAHSLRIISNVVTLGTIRVSEYIKIYNLNAKEHEKNVNISLAFLNEIQEIIDEIVEGRY